MGVMESLGKRIGLVACLFFLGLISLPSPGEATPLPNPGNNYGDMRSALKFLQDMDSYYGQIARPSSNYRKFQRRSASSDSDCPDESECGPEWNRFVALQGADDSVSRLSRPRFGKRSDSSQSDSDPRYEMLQNVDDSFSRLSRPRFGKRSDGLVVVPNQSDMYVYGGPSGGSIDLSKAKYVAI